MSRPQKMHKPLKGDFTQIINAIADGKGVKQSPQANRMTRSSESVKSANQPPKK
ncbi:MAG: hypothetical protein ABR955_04125 [Verrucomicrobiota bacterium]|jgi:hypothetical protein